MKKLAIASLAALMMTTVTMTGAAHAADHSRSHAVSKNFSKNRNDNRSDYRNDDRRGDWHYDRHGWDNDRAKGRAVYYYPAPPRYYSPPVRRVVYVYPDAYYRPYGYVRTYTIGGYLPRDRYWRDVPPWAAGNFPSAGYGQRWVYADRDALLISEATSRIISGIVLAASID